MIVITGGAGFIGSAVLWRLNQGGVRDVIIVDNLARTEKWRNLVKSDYMDYLDRRTFREFLQKKSMPWSIDSIVHLGACSSTLETDADFLMDNNFHFSRDLCRFALEKGTQFINASSAATYGAGEFGFNDDRETARKLKPLNMYGYSKQLFDLWALNNNLDRDITSLKFFNVYGPNEYHKGNMQSVAVKLFHEIRESGKATLFKSTVPNLADGCQARDFVYVKDCAELIWQLLHSGRNLGIRNVGTGTARTFNDLAESVFSAMGKPCRIEYRDMPAALAKNYQNYTCANMAWLQEMNFPIKFGDLETGISDYVNNYLANFDSYL